MRTLCRAGCASKIGAKSHRRTRPVAFVEKTAQSSLEETLALKSLLPKANSRRC